MTSRGDVLGEGLQYLALCNCFQGIIDERLLLASKFDKCLTSWFLSLSCFKCVTGLLTPFFFFRGEVVV